MIIAAPLIIAAHLETLPTLPGWNADVATSRPEVHVFEGAFTRRDEQRRWLTVGYVPNDAGAALHLEPITDGQRQNREAGSIACSLVVVAADVPAARAAVFDLLASWAQWLATDRTMTGTSGQARLMRDSSASIVVDLVLTTTRPGATASAVVTITYLATTYG